MRMRGETTAFHQELWPNSEITLKTIVNYSGFTLTAHNIQIHVCFAVVADGSSPRTFQIMCSEQTEWWSNDYPEEHKSNCVIQHIKPCSQIFAFKLIQYAHQIRMLPLLWHLMITRNTGITVSSSHLYSVYRVMSRSISFCFHFCFSCQRDMRSVSWVLFLKCIKANESG